MIPTRVKSLCRKKIILRNNSKLIDSYSPQQLCKLLPNSHYTIDSAFPRPFKIPLPVNHNPLWTALTYANAVSAGIRRYLRGDRKRQLYQNFCPGSVNHLLTHQIPRK